MPERPKRRKNNKNKRKNKQQSRLEVSKGQNTIDTKQEDEPEPIKNDDEPSSSAHISTESNVVDVHVELNDSQSESQINVSQYEIDKEIDKLYNTTEHLKVTEIKDTGFTNTISDTTELQDYLVESPDQSLKYKGKEKLGNTIKSKSLDNDDEPKIIEIAEYSEPKTDEISPEIINSSNVTVSDTESDVDWEVVNTLDDVALTKDGDMAVGTLSVQTIPLTTAKCENNQILTPDEELSLRKYLQTLDLATHPATLEIQTEIERTVEVKHRLRKKASPNDFIYTRGPRHLDVIDEEGSNESSLTSRRHSALNVTKNDCSDLEDDVFLSKEDIKINENKPNFRQNVKSISREIPQQCVLVDAKMVAPVISEARGNWSVQTMETLSGAEVVYLTDSSSSASDIYDLEEEDEVDDGIETDTSVRMITPTIEVTDTDNLLRKQFLLPKESECDHILVEQETDNTTSENPHEIIVLSTENINPSLYVLSTTDEKQENVNPSCTDLEEKPINDTGVNNTIVSTEKTDENITEVKSDFGLGDLRNELNDAFSNLVKEVSISENCNDNKGSVSRQDSSSSICSSQCTAKYNPNYSSLNDITNIMHDETPDSNIHTEDTKTMNTALSSHVKEVFECVTGSTKTNEKYENRYQPEVLKDLCVRRIAQFPYGEKILEELAHVSERLQNISIVRSTPSTDICDINKVKMPYYPLPDVSSIDKVALPTKNYNANCIDKIVPPPVLPRNSSLKKSVDEPHWTGIATHKDPVYVCLSPSQKMLMEKTKTVITKEDASQLVDMHKKYVDRRGYNENFKEEKVNRNENYENPIAIPFKSQTGSRLLALIRDPAVTNNIYSNSTRKHKSVELLHSNTTTHWDKKSICNNYNNSAKDINSGGIFKPIPPPRLKKYSSTVYESDESSDFTDNSLRSIKSERKFFHYSTGNLSKEIENDVSSIQSMHRHYVNTRETLDKESKPRRPSLPKDLCEQQMEYIRQKEKEIEAEINRLESKKLNAEKKPRAPLLTDKEILDEKYFDVNNYHISRKRDIALELPKLNENKKTLFSSSQEELLRDKMYTEYVTRMAERQERKEKKVIKITNGNKISKSLSSLEVVDPKMNNRIEEEFISKARERWNKLGIRDPETEDEREDGKNLYKEPVVIKHKIKVIEGSEEKEVQQLPSHLQEFVKFTAKKEQDASSPAVWRPGAPTPPPAPASPAPSVHSPATSGPPPPPLPVWTPNSAGPSPVTSRKSFRPVHFEETPPARRKQNISTARQENGCTSGSESESRLRTSQSAPVTGLNTLSGPSPPNRYPKAQNPTVTLLQKAREGQLPRGSNYLQERDSARLPRDRITPPRSDPVHALRREYASEGEAERSDYERGGSRKMADAHRKVEGIGPITKDGMPVALRSEVKDPSRWYKKMYDTIHKNKYDDDYVTVRYKNHRGQPGSPRAPSNKSQYAYFDPRSGYLSEPEGGLSRVSNWSDAYDSDVTSGPRRRTASVQEGRQDDELLSPYLPSNKYSTLASARASQEVYKNQPGRIEDYVPGKSSVVDKEAKQWWDEVMDIFDGWLDENSPLPPYGTLLARAIQKNQLSSTTSLPQSSPKEKKDLTSNILSKSNMARALKESGYESDSTLVFRRREDTDGPLSPAERRAAYRDLQAGGEPPLRGFRSPAPPRQDDSDIEYIPLSPTLTKIRVHKRQPQEVICYPLQYRQESTKDKSKKYSVNNDKHLFENPPAPPRRISSKNSRTLKLVTFTKPASTRTSPGRTLDVKEQSNVDFIKDKLRHKLVRQNTHTIISNKKISTDSKIIYNPANKQKRVASTSAPPAIDRKSTPLYSTPCKTIKRSTALPKMSKCTSSFSSPRRTLLPTEYTNPIFSKFGDSSNSRVVVEGGVGRKTPISNILDRVTPLDKLWNSEKRNGLRPVSPKSRNLPSLATKSAITKTTATNNITNRGRDMIRTSEKFKKIKSLNGKSTSCQSLQTKSENKATGSQSSTLKKSTSNVNLNSKKPQIKTATITNLKNKKTLDSLIYRPRSVPCHASCSKKNMSPTKLTKHTKESVNEKSKIDKQCDSQSYSNLNVNSDRNEKALKMRHINEIKEQRDNIVSDHFFQHLFLKNNLPSLPMGNFIEQDTSVLQKARMFQSYPQDFNISRSLNTYLINRKPVSESRFKLWDRYPSPEKYSSARSISWPGRMYRDVRKFDSLIGVREDFGSTTSLASIRSKSEPPTNKMYFSQTTRPKSPTVIFFKKQKSRSPSRELSPSKIIFTETSRPISPKIVHKVLVLPREKSKSPTKIIFTETSRPISPTKIHYPSQTIKKDEKIPSRIVFSETSRPVSPTITRRSISRSKSRSQSVSPVSIRSPSYRRIHSARLLGNRTDSIKSKKIIRTRSAGDADKSSYKPVERKLYNETDPDYDEYLRDIESNRMRSERFRELNRYYSYLERVGELERATSNCDLRHRKKDEEIIDFDRWKKIRSIERAEEELNSLYDKLRSAQNEKDVLFYPRDITDFRWNHDRERGLKIKEKSVEDLKEHFQQISDSDVDISLSRDTYKPLWRGTSVAETAFNINRKNETFEDNKILPKRAKSPCQQDSFFDVRKKLGIGSRLWSSLSMDQVNALKNQLNSIYSKDNKITTNAPPEKTYDNYTVNVTETTSIKPNLQVRSNSLISNDKHKFKESEICKSDSIAAINCTDSATKGPKNNSDQMTLSESEKKRISQTLSNEVLNRIKKMSVSSEKEIKSDTNFPKENGEINQKIALPIQERIQETIKSFERIVKTPKTEIEGNPDLRSEKSETSLPSSASETETASSDVSNKTVIYKGPVKEVQKKIDYFESVKTVSAQCKTIYHAREDSDENPHNRSDAITKIDSKSENQNMKQSQSCTNFKELFGESEKNKFLSLPPKGGRYSRSPSPHSEVYVVDRRTPDTLRYSSSETLCRSRSASPVSDSNLCAYLKLARAGEVRRLARRFDSPQPTLRRYRSDPELIRSGFRNNWQSMDKGLKRTISPVARVPLRPNNRFMPHIDIISKLAALRRRTTPRSRSADEVPECRPGEVDRMRRRFETMSILGQIYTSAPDVSELRDIAPYLAGPWIAHKYPKQNDNNKSVKDGTFIQGRRSPIRRDFKKKIVPKETVKLSSILKNDAFSSQVFDAAAHRPASRYEPPRAPPRPPPAAWPYRLAPYVTPHRHTVKFQETPEPPLRAPGSSISDTESPRRYLESDVNIHYRCPVRRDPLPLVPERELAKQQAEHMRKLYREQRRAKYLQDINPAHIDAFDESIKELQDMQNRRHQDNFTPSQKNILPLNRYDEAEKTIARALYTFNGQTGRELSFRKGDIINVRRQVDANWYEGELQGRVGLFPYNYVEILKGDVVAQKKPAIVEGRARAKFDFTAQTNLELPLKKGEIVTLTRRIDHNWWEGKRGSHTGIFPDSYVTVLQEPSLNKPEIVTSSEKPVGSPASHGLVNGSARRSMGSHVYTPQINSQSLSNAPPATQPLPGYTAKPAQATLTPSERGYGPPTGTGTDLNNAEPLYVDTNAEAVPYRAMYKYRPQNPDELELKEGDTVYVLEKCDDGWYVGSSQRTGRFGTFPGNYVERI